MVTPPCLATPEFSQQHGSLETNKADIIAIKKIPQKLALTITLCAIPVPGFTDDIKVAVASNFSSAIKEIARQFEVNSGHRVILSPGSSGKHYAQIINGAPFDVFFSADSERPQMLEEEGIAMAGSRFTYAVGKLVVWSPKSDKVDDKGKVLNSHNLGYLAIANPKLSPYGRATKQVLKNLGIWESLQGRTVRGENIAQTFQFVSSGNAALGFVAYTQIENTNAMIEGSFWEPPQSLYQPIAQQAVLLKKSEAAQVFITFVKSQQGQNIIAKYGFKQP